MSTKLKGKGKSKTQNIGIESDEDYNTQGFEPRESDPEKLWEVETILNERSGRYLIRWAGSDEHGNPWPDSWVPRGDVTDDLVRDWKIRKAELAKKKAERKRSSFNGRRKSNALSSVSSSKSTIGTRRSETHESKGVLSTTKLRTTRRTSNITSSQAKLETSPRPRSPPKKRKKSMSVEIDVNEPPSPELFTPRKKRKLQTNNPSRINTAFVNITSQRPGKSHTTGVENSESEANDEESEEGEEKFDEQRKKPPKPGPYFPPGTRPKNKKKKKSPPVYEKYEEEEDEEEDDLAGDTTSSLNGVHGKARVKEEKDEGEFYSRSNIPTDLPTPPHRTLRKKDEMALEVNSRAESPENSRQKLGGLPQSRSHSRSTTETSLEGTPIKENIPGSPSPIRGSITSRMKKRASREDGVKVNLNSMQNNGHSRDFVRQQETNEDCIIEPIYDQKDTKTQKTLDENSSGHQIYIPATQSQSQDLTMSSIDLQQHLQARTNARLPDVPDTSPVLNSSAVAELGSSAPKLDSSDRSALKDAEVDIANNGILIDQDGGASSSQIPLERQTEVGGTSLSLTSPAPSSSADRNNRPRVKTLAKIPLVSPSKFKPYLHPPGYKPLSAHITSALLLQQLEDETLSSIEQDSPEKKINARRGSRSYNKHHDSPGAGNDDIEDISGELSSDRPQVLSSQTEDDEKVRALESLYVDFEGNAGMTLRNASAKPRKLSLDDASKGDKENYGISMEDRPDDLESDDEKSSRLRSKPLEDPFIVKDPKNNANGPSTPTTTASLLDEDSLTTPPFRLLGSPTKLVKTPTQLLNESLGRITTLSNEIKDLKARLVDSEEKRVHQDKHISELEAEVVVLNKTLRQEREEHFTQDYISKPVEPQSTAVIDDLQRERDALTAEIALLKLKVEDSQKDSDLFREMYGKASSFVDELRKENLELESRATLAEGQVKKGLELIRLQGASQLKRVSEERDKARSQLKILMTKDRRTDDEVRRRAAREAELRPVIDELNAEIREVRTEMSRVVSERNVLMIKNKDVEEELEHVRMGEKKAQEELEKLQVELTRYAARERSVKKMLDQTTPSELEFNFDKDRDEEHVYLCEWGADDDEMACHKTFSTRQELQDHMFLAKDHL